MGDGLDADAGSGAGGSRQVGLKAGQLVELKVVGVSEKKRLLLSNAGKRPLTGRGR